MNVFDQIFEFLRAEIGSVTVPVSPVIFGKHFFHRGGPPVVEIRGGAPDLAKGWRNERRSLVCTVRGSHIV